MWWIVDTDNFGGDYPDEKFLLWGMPRDDAEKIAHILNERAGEGSPRFYKVERQGYVLQPGFTP